MFPQPSGPEPPRTLGDRVRRLNDELQRLALLLKTEIARVVGEAVASAVRDALRRLLGAPEEATHERPRSQLPTQEAWYDDSWEDPDSPTPEPVSPPRPASRDGRWSQAWRTAVQAGLWWLRRRPVKRPLLAATLVALAAGGAALALGPSAGMGVSAACSIAGALLNAGAARSVGERLADLAT